MILPSTSNEAGATAQLMLLQNRAHHEDRLQHTKHSIDNKLQDFSHLLKPKVAGKKQYLQQQKFKQIYDGNLSLLSKIHKITFDKNNEFASKYGVLPKQSKGDGASIMGLHPFSTDHRSRSMNTANRRKDLIKITKDNAHLLEKLRNMKPTVPDATQYKQRTKQLNYLKQLTQKRDETQPSRLLNGYMQQRSRGFSVMDKYMQKHELWNSRDYEQMQNDSSYFTSDDYNNSFDIQSKMMRRPRNLEDQQNRSRSRNDITNMSNSLSMSADYSVFENIPEASRTGKSVNKNGNLLPAFPQAYLKYGVGEIIREEVNKEGLYVNQKNPKNI